MSIRIQSVLAAAIVAILPGAAFGQSTPNEPIKTTLCELVKTLDQFNGKTAQFRAEFVSKFQWEGFVDEGCSAKLQIGGNHPLDDLRPEQGQYAFTTASDDNTHPERLNWKPIPVSLPIDLKQNDDYRAFRRYAVTKFRWPDGGVCADCPLYRITVKATGRFDHFETGTVAVRANPSAKALQYSVMDAPLSRFVLQSVSEVSAVPIDGSVYSAVKPRNISLEEAYDLVLIPSGCMDGSCELVPYHPDSDFYGFQALWINPPGASINRGFFVVDPRTTDVWSGVICERYASRSLAKLQRAIRKRIGLTDEEYRKAAKTGPMCGPGLPRVRRGE